MAYLYGASIQGIQDFVFSTNKLREIVGASEIVEDISTDFIKSFLVEQSIVEYEIIVMAAGNVKISFSNKDDLKKVVNSLSKKVMQKAYGITISQAVVEYDGFIDKDVMNSLEKKLKIARNSSHVPLDCSLNIVSLAPRTGKSQVAKDKDKKPIDKATSQKLHQADEGKSRLLKKLEIDSDLNKFPDDMGSMKNAKGKIAVIHADGNGLGMLLQSIGEALEDRPQKVKEAYKSFSTKLDTATISAVKKAFEETFDMSEPIIKFRPIVIGGDDLSVICDADKAIKFTEKFLRYFESETKDNLESFVKEYKLDVFKDGLTACAGIAYSNEKYPFHYAINLAENLCSHAKMESKKINPTLAPSSLMFHNIQSSFFTSYKEYIEAELTINEIALNFGPYFINPQDDRAMIVDFIEVFDSFNSENSPLSKLRSWLTELSYHNEHAQILLHRIDQLAKESKFDSSSLKKLHPQLSLTNLIVDNQTPIYDILQIKSVTGVSS